MLHFFVPHFVPTSKHGTVHADYIDTGRNYLEVLFLTNMTRVTRGLAAATRIDRYRINETCPVIVSQLNFMVQANIPTSQISCINVNKGCRDTIEFNVSSKFSMEQTMGTLHALVHADINHFGCVYI